VDHIGLASFATLYGQVQGFVQDSSTDRLTKIKDRINWNYFAAWQRHDWRDLRRLHEGRHAHITSADNLTDYPSATLDAFQTNGYEAMPFDVGEIYAITMGSPGGTMASPPIVQKRDQAEFFDLIAYDPDLTGPAEIWTLAGTTPLRRPLVVNEQLRFASTSASDTTTVRLSGISSSAYYGMDTAESITLTGTTSVNSSTTYSRGWSILSLNFQGALAGTVNVTGATSGVTYMQFLPMSGLTDGPNYSQRLLVRFYPCPTSGTSYSLLYKRKCAKLINDRDVPLWNIGPYLVEKTIADIYEQMRLPEIAALHHQKAEALIAQMIFNEESSVTHSSRPMTYASWMRGLQPVRPGP
jgi:hypothetical protein